tara:strand:- start:12380 stop:12535 length:156 start_codon:yes stop_codon:yes gene_type:complete
MKLWQREFNPTLRMKWVDSKKVLKPGQQTKVLYEPGILAAIEKIRNKRKKP